MRVTYAIYGLSYHVVPRPHCTFSTFSAKCCAVAQSHSVGVFQAEHPGEPMPLAPLLAISALATKIGSILDGHRKTHDADTCPATQF